MQLLHDDNIAKSYAASAFAGLSMHKKEHATTAVCILSSSPELRNSTNFGIAPACRILS